MADHGRRPAPDPAPSFEEWRRLVEASLKGRPFETLRARTRDGIIIDPLYSARSERPPLPGREGRPWRIVQVVDDPDPDCANRQALADIAGGATGLAIRFAGAPAASGVGLPASEGALRIALENVDLARIHVRIDPHPGAAASALWLRDEALRQGIAPERADLAFGLDPIAVLALESDGEPDIASFAGAFGAIAERGFGGTIVELDTRVYHEAGASEAQELAAALASAVWWLRALDASGIGAEAALPRFGATMAVDRDQFLSTAKLRALRLVWARLLEVCGAPSTPLAVHAETSRRMLTRADPHTNLLRTTIAAFAAGTGGADTVTVLPHTAALGPADAEARALARNIQYLLIEEANVHRVADPAAGSGAVEALTEELAERAWAEFQAIEREGGIVASLVAGAFQSRIANARAALVEEVTSGAAPLVGATVYRESQGDSAGAPHPAETLPVRGLVPIRLEALAGAG
jgi:methylmalonyl-CoA mutase